MYDMWTWEQSMVHHRLRREAQPVESVGSMCGTLGRTHRKSKSYPDLRPSSTHSSPRQVLEACTLWRYGRAIIVPDDVH